MSWKSKTVMATACGFGATRPKRVLGIAQAETKELLDKQAKDEQT